MLVSISHVMLWKVTRIHFGLLPLVLLATQCMEPFCLVNLDLMIFSMAHFDPSILGLNLPGGPLTNTVIISSGNIHRAHLPYQGIPK